MKVRQASSPVKKGTSPRQAGFRRRPRVFLLSLGCAKNQVDGEKALGVFQQQGFELVANADQADVVVVTTCAFIRTAAEEAVQALLEAARLKRGRRIRVLLAAGCLVSRYGAKTLLEQIPELDDALLPEDFPRLAARAKSLLTPAGDDLQATGSEPARMPLSGPGSAYLKIAEGCNRRCAYCLIPRLRGPLRSYPPDALVQEAAGLSAGGRGEIIVVAQDITAYGQDLPGRPPLTALLDRLLRIRNLRWLRLMYANPEGVGEPLIRRLAAERKLCKYLDMPVQHAHRAVLRRMGRPGDGAFYLQLAARLRRRIPGMALRTTLLTGFPGESESEHQTLLQFLAAARFDRVGVFAYSREEGTRAAAMPGQVPFSTRQRRRRELLALQEPISAAALAQRVGQELECLVEEPSGSDHVVARTIYDAPDVDGAIVLQSRACPGAFVRARVTGATAHDLTGVSL